MKVLILNGSPKANGNTAIAINEIVKVFDGEGIDSEIIQIGNRDIRGCISCNSCRNTGKCVFDDIVNELAQKFEDAEGLQTMRTLARNMAFLMKSIALGRERYGLPDKEEHLWTHFIR